MCGGEKPLPPGSGPVTSLYLLTAHSCFSIAGDIPAYRKQEDGLLLGVEVCFAGENHGLHSVFGH